MQTLFWNDYGKLISIVDDVNLTQIFNVDNSRRWTECCANTLSVHFCLTNNANSRPIRVSFDVAQRNCLKLVGLVSRFVLKLTGKPAVWVMSWALLLRTSVMSLIFLLGQSMQTNRSWETGDSETQYTSWLAALPNIVQTISPSWLALETGNGCSEILTWATFGWNPIWPKMFGISWGFQSKR